MKKNGTRVVPGEHQNGVLFPKGNESSHTESGEIIRRGSVGFEGNQVRGQAFAKCRQVGVLMTARTLFSRWRIMLALFAEAEVRTSSWLA